MRNAPCLIECSNEIDILIDKIDHTVCMFRHGEMSHARGIAQHRNGAWRGNSAFLFQLTNDICSPKV